MNPSPVLQREPFGDDVIIVDTKLTDYILSQSHRIGANKARVFKAALGIEKAEVAVLRDALFEAARTQRPNFVRKDDYGQHFAIVFELSYGKKSAYVRSLWMIKTGDDTAYLVSAFVVSDKRALSEVKDNE
jgi:sulfur relay (sulfurtransferase) DsrF/TusC family protein